MDEHVKSELYRDHNIRSSPYKGQQKWKAFLNITFPTGNGADVIIEYAYEEECHSTQNEAHNAGVELGKRVIDERIKTGRIPSGSRLASGLPRP